MKYRDVVRLIEAAGLRLDRTIGSHQQYRHPTRSGTVTVPAGGQMSRDAPPGTVNSILKQAGVKLNIMEYTAVIERASDGSFSAYVPDLPGCVSSGDHEEVVRALIAEVVQLHIASLRSHGEQVPLPSSKTCIVQAA